jgi:hypothetical protein
MVDGRYTRWFSFTFCCWNLACLMFFSQLFPFPPYNFFLNTIFVFVFRCSVVLGHEAATTVCALEAHCTRQDLLMSAVSTVAAQPGAPISTGGNVVAVDGGATHFHGGVIGSCTARKQISFLSVEKIYTNSTRRLGRLASHEMSRAWWC